MAQNVYVGSRVAFGPDPPNRTNSEWEIALLAGDVHETLCTLGWLAGDQQEGGEAGMEQMLAVLEACRLLGKA